MELLIAPSPSSLQWASKYQSQKPGVSLGSPTLLSPHRIHQSILSLLPLKIFQILSLLSSSTATISGEPPFSASPLPPPIEFPYTLARVIVLTHKSDQPFSSLKPCGGFPLCWNETQTLYHAWAGSQLGLLPASLTSSRHTSFLSAPNGPAVMVSAL